MRIPVFPQSLRLIAQECQRKKTGCLFV